MAAIIGSNGARSQMTNADSQSTAGEPLSLIKTTIAGRKNRPPKSRFCLFKYYSNMVKNSKKYNNLKSLRANCT